MATRELKKGEFLFKDGEKNQGLYLIQSGGISLCLQRGKKLIDVFQLGPNQILGENLILGSPISPLSAMATTHTQVIEVPIEHAKQQYENAPQILKAMVKSLADRLRLATNEVKSKKLETDSSPCPEDKIASTFGSIYHTAIRKGEKNKDGTTLMDWTMLRQYAQRIFSESPKRMEQIIQILFKLGYVQYEMGKNPEKPEGPEEIQKILFLNLNSVEAFFEYYQYYYFKGTGKNEVLKVEDLPYFLLAGLVKLGSNLEPDRFGIINVPLSDYTDYCKNELDINLNNDHFTRLEHKGLFCKRANSEKGVQLQFERKEFEYTFFAWRVIREIEKLNERGYVDLNEKEVRPKKKSDGGSCPQCQAPLTANAKFCSECGSKLQNAA